MAKLKTVFQCNACGAESPKWTGQCPGCGAWNTLTESVQAAANSAREARYRALAPSSKVESLNHIATENIARLSSGLPELDRVLGGGLVVGSVVLLGGDPGIGKSTLLLQALDRLGQDAKVLYVTGEESSSQVAMRAQRLGLPATGVRMLAETRLEPILACAQSEQPQVMVIDSIQTVSTELLQSAPGSVSQVRESAAQLVTYAKHSGVALFLVGHVTKEGALAGPRVLEHMVDTVLYFEGDSSSRFRLVRAIKNRFGAVNELGVFVMSETGLREVANPSAMFINQQSEPVAGSVVLATQEGTRPLLVEVQALVDESHLSNPRRISVGIDGNRLAMLLAVLHRHCGVSTLGQDVFVNIAGGIRVNETASDLAILAAILSSLRDKAIGRDCLVFGEVGLGGEIRPVQRGQERIREAAKLGFRHALVPHANRPKQLPDGIEVIPVKRLDDALTRLFEI